MISIPDGRGSIGQRRIFQLVKEIYPQYSIIWEQQIDPINMRFDIFVKELGIAIEVDGSQHNSPNMFFQPNPYDFKKAYLSDEAKNMFCELNGIKLIRLDYKEALNLEIDRLKDRINKTRYPESVFTYSCLTSS